MWEDDGSSGDYYVQDLVIFDSDVNRSDNLIVDVDGAYCDGDNGAAEFYLKYEYATVGETVTYEMYN